MSFLQNLFINTRKKIKWGRREEEGKDKWSEGFIFFQRKKKGKVKWKERVREKGKRMKARFYSLGKRESLIFFPQGKGNLKVKS